VSTEAKFKYLIVGFGPTGLSVLDQLLLKGVAASEIAIMGMKQSLEMSGLLKKTKANPDRDPILNSRKSKVYGVQKLGVDTSLLNDHTLGLANFWGASHLPPVFYGLNYEGFFTQDDIKEAIFASARMMQIQAEAQHKFTDVLPIYGEEIGGISRKEVSNNWVNENNTDFIHSRLSIGGHRDSQNSCKSSGRCFKGCPSGAFWSPILELKHLIRENSELSMFYGEVSTIDLRQKSVSVVDSTPIFFETLFLCCGPKNSIKILNQSNVTSELMDYCYSPVVMQPFIIKATSEDEYENSHVLADLVLPIFRERQISALAQIYFPTSELSSNILSKIPVIFLPILRMFPMKLLDLFLRRIGISMLFLENVEFGTTRKSILQLLTRPLKDLKSQLELVDSKLLKIFKVIAIDGGSHHTGSLFLKSEKTKRGMNSDVFKNLKINGVYLADGLALVEIPPGPHTNTICIIARCLAMDALRN
jgi:hypothetical protein